MKKDGRWENKGTVPGVLNLSTNGGDGSASYPDGTSLVPTV